ncbi:ribosome recycling factor, partial [Martensiomyces pterosporus]
QCRTYGSKKKGGKKGSSSSKKQADDDEGSSEPVEMTLDMDKMAEQMSHSVERFALELQALRAGRANPAMLDHVRVLLKGGSAVLSDLAMISIKDAQNLIVIPNSEEDQKPIEASIRNAGLGLNPRIDKNAVVVPVPKPTKESREKLLKSIGSMAEHARVHVRKHRQDAMKRLKADSKQSMPKDEVKAWEKDIQAETDKHTSKIEELLRAKHREI